MSEPVRVGIVGLGFMGRTHLGAYRAAAEAGVANRLVAVADPSPDRRAGKLDAGGNLDTGEAGFDPAQVRGHERAEALFADPDVDLVSICTPTDTHVELAAKALGAGRHVLVEKPLATRSDCLEELVRLDRGSPGLCMPAMCIRFWPGYTWLADAIREGTYGRLLGLTCVRLGTRPDWGSGFYADAGRTGGALFDLHVHDADFVRHCLGNPEAISASGDVDHVSSLWHYPAAADGTPGPRVQLEGGWDQPPGFPFRMEFRAVFETAAVEFRLGAEAEFWIDREGERVALPLADDDGYRGEVRAILRAISAGADRPPATVAEALEVTRLLEATARAQSSGRTVECDPAGAQLG